MGRCTGSDALSASNIASGQLENRGSGDSTVPVILNILRPFENQGLGDSNVPRYKVILHPPAPFLRYVRKAS